MNKRPIRAPNAETEERKLTRLARQEILNEQRAFLASFDEQIASITARSSKPE